MSNLFSHRVTIPSLSEHPAISPDVEKSIRQILADASPTEQNLPGEIVHVQWKPFTHPDEAGSWFSDLFSPGFAFGRNRPWVVGYKITLPTGSGDIRDEQPSGAPPQIFRTLAIVGNGPNAEHNARLFAHAPAIIHGLLDDLSAARAEISALRFALDEYEKLEAALLKEYGISITIEDGKAALAQGEIPEDNTEDEDR